MINAHDLYTTFRVLFCYYRIRKGVIPLYMIESYDNEQFVPDWINYDFGRIDVWLGNIGTRTQEEKAYTLAIARLEQ